MRLYLKHSERRAEPAPVETDDRRAILTGVVIWGAALIVAVLVPSVMGQWSSALWTCIAGFALGLAGLVYTQFRRR
ncbi:DUF2530 domain-containing protein [Amnibacterium flavum]|uniref:DUF2530 domain-containing protein n=1 Tax=Amnibacterium flavum TaxID=2173173 RepID=A0A2V1HL42_9MICO|nr:DUF2530 domain-containing protein [Amnibacterium flavum]PVZ93343.1 DUF2530 domain-containing protein [Amnibacterium flavum]